MKSARKNTIFQRIDPLIKQLGNKAFRSSYLDSHVKLFIATQIRNLRGNRSQKDFAKKLGTTQSVISRYENPEYGQVTVQTLIDIANKLDIALVVRFASYPDFLTITSDFSENAQTPKPYNQKSLDLMHKDLATGETSAKTYIKYAKDDPGMGIPDTGSRFIEYSNNRAA